MQWPRFFEGSGYEFAVYQPQVSRWPSNHLEGRFATAVRPAGTSNETYGVVFFQARTEIDKVNRLVTLEDFQVTKLAFPTLPKASQGRYRTIIQERLPQAAKTIPLDHLEAVFVVSAEVAKAKIQRVKNEPPWILYAMQPSILILVDGAPVLRPLVGSYERVINTRSILLQNPNSFYQGCYLYAAGYWYSASAIEGPWTVNPAPPEDLNAALKAALATKEVDPMYPQAPLASPPDVLISTRPAELLQTAGPANMLPISGTALLYISNTDNAIFYYQGDGNYYVLISGRWFKSLSLYGPWTFVAAGQLPTDFKRIPPRGPKANILASVPGTPMAREAVIANAIPQTATIERDQAKLTVDYAGAPSFVPIAGTSVAYAPNTATPVIMVNAASYYACQGGVWFASTSPAGPWAVATFVPSAIYAIPVSCPIHYVTYVYVYGSTATRVYAGYTPGYVGTVVAPGGVVVYGTGYDYPPVIIGTTYVAYPPTYGYGWGMAVGAAAGYAFGYCAGSSCSGCCCEPYWGCYHWVAPYGYSYTHINCNSASLYMHWGTAVHATGSYGYNAYTGASWGSQHATTFNPYTGTSGQASRGAGYNPYSGNYAGGKQGSWYNPYSRTSSSDSHGVVGKANTGNAVAWNNGNLYTDKNGNVNKYNPTTSSWDKYGNSGWQGTYQPAAPTYSSPASSTWGSGSPPGRTEGGTARAGTIRGTPSPAWIARAGGSHWARSASVAGAAPAEAGGAVFAGVAEAGAGSKSK